MQISEPNQKIRICFLIRSLDLGGSERQLLELVRGLDPSRFQVSVLTFYSEGALVEELSRVPYVEPVTLNKQGRWDIFRFLTALVVETRKRKPQLLHSYLGSANVLGIFLKPFLPKTKVVWGVRSSNMDLSRYDRLSRIFWRLERTVSPFADRIIANSKAGKAYAVANGFPADKITVIPNGIDTQKFSPENQSGIDLRSVWGFRPGRCLVGIVGRIDPMKDHVTFVKAAVIAAEKDPSLDFVIVGGGSQAIRDAASSVGKKLEDEGRLRWVGAQTEMVSVYRSLDINCSSSVTEGFSNSIGEAMASGVPCVVTDVGDSAWIVGETGVVVPPRDSEALAKGLLLLTQKLRLSRGPLKQSARSRVMDNFSFDRLIERTSRELRTMVGDVLSVEASGKQEIHAQP